MVTRFRGSGREKEGGYLATHRQDFNAHRTGGDWRHKANQIDMNPSLTNYPAVNVQGTFEALAASIGSSGVGFVSVGDIRADGYVAGNYNVGSTATPTFREAILAAFNDDRLENGGIVFILPGTYNLVTTVEVPSGISIMGEISGTVIIGEMSEEPMFRFLRATDYTSVGTFAGSSIETDIGSPVDESRLFNIILADNLDGYAGDIVHGNSTMQTVPMVEIEASSRVHIENVKFIGRVNDEAVSGRGKTYAAIGTTTGGSVGSNLTVRRCFFDGMQIGIDFTPGNGNLDTLLVDQCRVRIFGEETAVATNLAENSFISMSLCNLTATNNHIVGYGTWGTQWVAVCFTISSISTGNGSDDVNIIITGTTGNPSNSAPTYTVFYNEAGSDSSTNWATKAHIAGNNWGADINSSWHVTVGGGSSITDDRFGDFQGPGAIDFLISASLAYPVTVIVNAGTYEVTQEDVTIGARYNFIGNKRGGDRPIFDMNLGSGATTDEIGNRTFTLGFKTEFIKFRSSTTSTGTTSFHSIRPTADGESASVKDCKFENCTLSFDGYIDENIDVVGCTFIQDDTLDDNIGLLAPGTSERIVVEKCSFSGNGYAGFIGNDSGIGYANSAPNENSTVVIRDCVMDLTGYGIDDSTQMSKGNYFAIDLGGHTDDYGRIEISNCQILSDNTYAQRTNAINQSLLSNIAPSNIFEFVFIRARDINVNNTIIHAPTQYYPVFFNPNAPIPGIRFVPWRRIEIIDSKFYDGGIPCLVTGFTDQGIKGGLSADGYGDGVFIRGCRFATHGNPISQTCLSIDLNPSDTTPEAVISITDCTFSQQYDINTSLAVYHSDMGNSTSYTAVGLVQIYAFDFAVNFYNNIVAGLLAGTLPTNRTHTAGVVISTTTDNNGDDGQYVRKVGVHDNNIDILNNFSSSTSTDTATALWVNAILFDIHDNSISMDNKASLSNSAIGCAWFNITSVDAVDGYASESIVHDNFFSRRSKSGEETSIGRTGNAGGFIYIPATSLGGRIVDNVFGSTTTDGTNTDIIEDSSSNWIFTRNKNQTESIVVSPYHGFFGINTGLSNNLTMINDPTQTHTSRLELTRESISPYLSTVNFYYTDTGSDMTGTWSVPVKDIITDNSYLVNATLQYSVGTIVTSGDLDISIVDQSGSAPESLSTVDITGGATNGTTTFTPTGGSAPGGGYYNENGLILRFVVGINDSSPERFEFEKLTITYRWT